MEDLWKIEFGIILSYGIGYLSGEGGAKLAINSNTPNAVKTQLDIVAVDTEVALAIECKSSKEYKKRLNFKKN